MKIVFIPLSLAGDVLGEELRNEGKKNHDTQKGIYHLSSVKK